jgi:hypothetical protein
MRLYMWTDRAQLWTGKRKRGAETPTAMGLPQNLPEFEDCGVEAVRRCVRKAALGADRRKSVRSYNASGEMLQPPATSVSSLFQLADWEK